MAQKYTILKVLIQNLSKIRHSDKGFTLLELIAGMVILVSIIGLAMNAFISASSDFNKDKKAIDSSQSLSAVLELIGSDIRQAGEQINDANFPVIEFSTDPSSSAIPPSSKITVRKALVTSLTLCQNIPVDVSPLPNTLLVADSTSTNTNCSGLAMTTTPAPILPGALRNVRNYRCQLDNPDADYAATTADLCAASKPSLPSKDPEQVRAAISDGSGHLRTFNYSDDNIITAASQYSITVGKDDLGGSTMLDDARNKAYPYNIGQPIYLIEERVYTLDNDGSLKLSIDGKTPTTLIKKIAKFSVSAKLYQNTATVLLSTKTTATAPANPCVAGTNTQFLSDSQYTCKFNANTTSAATADNWKTLAGVKVELQAKYDSTGGSATPSTTDTEKLQATAEFFPRNVLSK